LSFDRPARIMSVGCGSDDVAYAVPAGTTDEPSVIEDQAPAGRRGFVIAPLSGVLGH
jgi:hypothetical protein